MGAANTTAHAGGQSGTRGTNQPPATTPQASIVEPRPRVEAAVSEEMFLSPRVLDAGAFTRYSEMLRSIIAQASAQGRTLEDFSADAEAMIKQCDTTSEAINKRMQAGVRMLKMIDERAERTDALLGKVQAALPDSAALAARIDAVVERRLAEAEERISGIVDRAEARAAAAEQRAGEAEARSERQGAALAEISERIDAQMAALEARTEQGKDETERTLETLLERTRAARESLDGSLDASLGRAAEAGADLALKVDEASRITETRITELSRSISPVLEASAQVMRTLGMDPRKPVFEDSPLARIETLVERGETQIASLDRVYRQIEELQSQAQGVRTDFGEWLVGAARELDSLETRKEALVGPMSAAADKVSRLAPDLETNLELASTKLGHLQSEQRSLREAIRASTSVADEVSARISNQSGQLQALLDGSLHKLSARVEQAAVWLGTLIQRAESLGVAMGGEPPALQPVEGITGTREAINGTRTPVQAPVQVAPQAPATIEPPAKKAGLVSPQPPRLPIDGFSFDGASGVITRRD